MEELVPAALQPTLQWFAQLGRVAWQSSLADKLAEWLSGSIAGKISVGVFAYLLLRSPLDSLWRRIHGYPPGTIGLVPFFSTMKRLMEVISNNEIVIRERENYGPISMHCAGPVNFIFLNTKEACEIGFKKDRLVNRHPQRSEQDEREHFEYLKPLTGTLSFMSTDGKSWKLRRKLMLNSVNLDGDKLDRVVEGSIQQIIDNLNSSSESSSSSSTKDGSSICWSNMRKDLLFLTFSTIYRSSFGLDHFPKETELRQFIAAVHDFFEFLPIMLQVLVLPPWVGLKFGQVLAGEAAKKSRVGLSLMSDWIDKYQAELMNENRRYVHNLIEAVEEGQLSKEQAASDMRLSFVGASHTSQSTLEFALINAASHIEYQSRVCDELKQAFSDRSEITLKRVQTECPFLQAFVFETLRLTTVSPHTFNRTCVEDMKILGYTIPKGSSIVANTMCISRDKEEWPNQDPNEFYPQRWMIDDHTLMDKKMDKLALFGYGDRQCPGKNLAVRQLCLLFAHLLYEHEFTLTDSSKLRELCYLDWHLEDSPIPLSVQKRT